jgi:hypothetical protein
MINKNIEIHKIKEKTKDSNKDNDKDKDKGILLNKDRDYNNNNVLKEINVHFNLPTIIQILINQTVSNSLHLKPTIYILLLHPVMELEFVKETFLNHQHPLTKIITGNQDSSSSQEIEIEMLS